MRIPGGGRGVVWQFPDHELWPRWEEAKCPHHVGEGGSVSPPASS